MRIVAVFPAVADRVRARSHQQLERSGCVQFLVRLGVDVSGGRQAFSNKRVSATVVDGTYGYFLVNSSDAAYFILGEKTTWGF